MRGISDGDDKYDQVMLNRCANAPSEPFKEILDMHREAEYKMYGLVARGLYAETRLSLLEGASSYPKVCAGPRGQCAFTKVGLWPFIASQSLDVLEANSWDLTE